MRNRKQCDRVLALILDGQSAVPFVRKHLEHCSECRALAGTWALMGKAPRMEVPEIPETLDHRILDFAAQAAKERPARKTAEKKHFFVWFGSAAALFLLTFAAVFYYSGASLPGASGPEKTICAASSGAWDLSGLNTELTALAEDLEFSSECLAVCEENFRDFDFLQDWKDPADPDLSEIN